MAFINISDYQSRTLIFFFSLCVACLTSSSNFSFFPKFLYFQSLMLYVWSFLSDLYFHLSLRFALSSFVSLLWFHIMPFFPLGVEKNHQIKLSFTTPSRGEMCTILPLIFYLPTLPEAKGLLCSDGVFLSIPILRFAPFLCLLYDFRAFKWAFLLFLGWPFGNYIILWWFKWYYYFCFEISIAPNSLSWYRNGFPSMLYLYVIDFGHFESG